MSLIVCPYERAVENGTLVWIDGGAASGHNELAGFEACRTALWSAACVRALGLTLLPSLADGDVYAEGDALDELEREVARIVQHLPAIAAATGYSVEFIEFRAGNIADAVRRARSVPGRRGGVYIG